MGQLPADSITLIQTADDVALIEASDPKKLAYITQTTLSVDDTKDIIAALRARFPDIQGPRKEDICYATTNRQEAVKTMAARCDALLVVGSFLRIKPRVTRREKTSRANIIYRCRFTPGFFLCKACFTQILNHGVWTIYLTFKRKRSKTLIITAPIVKTRKK